MIESKKEVTRKTRETYFLHRKPQKLKIVKQTLFFETCFRKIAFRIDAFFSSNFLAFL